MRTARILVPPGIGDGYWVLCKLRGFLAGHSIGRAEIYVHDAAPRRSAEMWGYVPFVKFGGYAKVPRDSTARKRQDKQALHRAYHLHGFAMQRDTCGFDYLLSFNGALVNGVTLDRAMPGPSNWYERIHDAEKTEARACEYRNRYGDYIVAAFWSGGFYGELIAEFPETKIIDALRGLADSGKTVVVMGASWDKNGIGERIAAADERFVNLVGETNYDDLMGLLSGSSAIVGFPAGNTLLGPYFRKPTVLLWGHFKKAMWRNCVPPDAVRYRALATAGLTPDAVISTTLDLLGEHATIG